MPPTANLAVPPALRALGLDDPTQFRILRRVPIFDEHPATLKYVADASRKTPANPTGLRAVSLGATRQDLDQLARNSNARIARGLPPSLQLGHSMPGNVPERDQPKAVGFPFNFVVGEHDGRACLFADLAYRAEHHAEAVTYPRGSIERSNWTDPASQHVQALALIRCRPGCDLPPVPYAASPGGMVALGEPVQLFEAARSARVDAKVREIVEGRAAAAAEQAASAARPAPLSRIEFATRHRIHNQRELDRRYHEAYPGTPAAVAYAAQATKPQPRPTLVEFAQQHRIHDVREARRRYALAYPDPAAPVARYNAGRPVVAKIPNDPRARMELQATKPYAAARSAYAQLNRVYALVQAGHDLEREIRAGLLAFDAADGSLVFPPAPLADDPANTPSDLDHYRERRAAFWQAGGAIGPDGTPRFAQVEADTPARVTARGTPPPSSGPGLTPRARQAIGQNVDLGRDPNAVRGPANPNPRRPGW